MKRMDIEKLAKQGDGVEVDVLKDIRKYFPDLKTNKELLTDRTSRVSWLIEGLLIEGGSSLLVSEPKTGKSVLARQLAYAVSTGSKILNRRVKKGLVFYISVEDHPGWIKQHMNSMGSVDDDSILWSLGRIKDKNFVEGIRFVCEKVRPAFIVIDTMFKVFRIADINDYNTMIEALQSATEVAREFGTHILYIHHVNKAYKKNNNSMDFSDNRADATLSRIMGSTGIAGEVDNILFMTRNGDTRSLVTIPRCGDQIDEVLYWDECRSLYLINEI